MVKLLFLMRAIDERGDTFFTYEEVKVDGPGETEWFCNHSVAILKLGFFGDRADNIDVRSFRVGNYEMMIGDTPLEMIRIRNVNGLDGDRDAKQKQGLAAWLWQMSVTVEAVVKRSERVLVVLVNRGESNTGIGAP